MASSHAGPPDFAEAVLEASADGIIVVDGDGIVVRANPAAAELMGVPVERLTGGPFGVMAGEDVGGRGSEMQVVRSDGETRTVEVRTSSTTWRGENVTVLSLRDISERQRADELTRRLISIIDVTPNMVGMADAEGRATYINPAGRRLLGLGEREPLGERRFAGFHPPEAARTIQEVGIPTAVEHGRWEGETELLGRGGRRIPIWQAILAHFGDDGRLSFLSTVIQDLTARKAVEDALRERVKELRALYSATRELARPEVPIRERIESAIATLPAGFLHPTLTEVRVRWGKEAVQTPRFVETEWLLRAPIRSRGVEVGMLEVVLLEGPSAGNGEPFLPEEEELVSALATVIGDALERERLQAEFVQAQKLETIGRLAGGAAHDFNNLLSVIQGHAEIALLDLGKGSPAVPDLEQIVRAAGRGASLTQQLLAFSRKVVLEERVVDLRDAVREVEPMLRRVVPSRIGVDVSVGARPATVRLDTARFDQVVLNLVINAVDAIRDEGEIEVSVEVVAHPRLGEAVQVRVLDDGAGIAPELVGRVFEPFFTTKPRGRGTGLGLSMVYGFVEQSRGEISLDTEEGRGTAVVLDFPLVEAGDMGALDGEAGDGPDDAGREGRRGVVLVVDDDEAVRRVLVRILANAGHEVLEADDGEEALATVRSAGGRIDVVVTDVVMPRLGGVGLIDRLGSLELGPGVIVMSGHSEREIGNRLAARRASFLSKPFSRDEVLQLIANKLEERDRKG